MGKRVKAWRAGQGRVRTGGLWAFRGHLQWARAGPCLATQARRSSGRPVTWQNRCFHASIEQILSVFDQLHVLKMVCVPQNNT